MLRNQKHLFSLRDDIHYLNNAYKAPLLKTAEKAAINALIKERNPVDISEGDFFSGIEEVKTLFGSLVNCPPDNVALIPSVSYGFASVLKSFKGKKGGVAITIEDEFPSGVFSLKRWAKENDNSLLTIGPDDGHENRAASWNDNIINAINDNTSAVLLSSVHWIDGLKFDLQAIGNKCKEHNVKLLVDGTQSAGALPIDLETLNIDALVCGGYKWLFGPYSLGLSYINPSFNSGSPLEESWMNRKNAKNFRRLTEYEDEYFPNASKYNVGETSNFILMPILKAGLQQVLDWDPKNIQIYSKKLKGYLIEHLELDPNLMDEKYYSNHLFGLNLSHLVNGDILNSKLKEEQVYVSMRGENIRIAINLFNTKEDIDALLKAIKRSRH